MITAPAPAPIDPSAHWRAVADELAAHPGQWRTVADRDTADAAKYLAYDIRAGRLAAFRPAGRFDARPVGTAVRARYLTSTTTARSPEDQ